MRVIVDNRGAADAALASALADGLRAVGFEVQQRDPEPTSMFDTSVHVVVSALALRVDATPDTAQRTAIRTAVRTVLERSPAPRRRTQSVPVYLGDGARVLDWIDAVD